MNTSASSMSRIAPQLFAVLKCLVKFNSTTFGSVPMSLLVSVISGRFVYSAMHSENPISAILTEKIERRSKEDKALTCSVRLPHAWSTMQKKCHPGSFPLDEVRSPCRSVDSITLLVDSYKALGKSFQSCNSVLIRDETVDHLLLKLRLLEVFDVKDV